MRYEQAIPGVIAPPGTPGTENVIRSITRYISSAFMVPAVRRLMSSAAQRTNLCLLAEQVMAFNIPGDIVELGCHTGETTRAIAQACQQLGAGRNIHVYDDFKFDPTGNGQVRRQFVSGFARSGLDLPMIHEGDLYRTLPDELPDRIAFAHIDLGSEEEPRQVARLVWKCLYAIYPRMEPGAICVLMDHHDPARTVKGWDRSPGVKLACDQFMFDKPERIRVLFGEQYSHAFFRKARRS